jgi:hypothetical protein
MCHKCEKVAPSWGLGERATKRESAHTGAGQDVCARCNLSQGGSDHGKAVWYGRIVHAGKLTASFHR